jgi:hypothetical protein
VSWSVPTFTKPVLRPLAASAFRTSSLMNPNWASRSGCCLPSFVLRVRVGASCATVSWLMAWPAA